MTYSRKNISLSYINKHFICDLDHKLFFGIEKANVKF